MVTAVTMLTAFLSRTDVARHVNALILLSELRQAFTTRQHPPSPRITASASDATVMRHATLEGFPAWAVTVRTQTAKGMRSLLQLHDAESGQLLAMMDANHLMALRASLVSALAADVLARPDAKNVAILGAGSAASSALKALRLVRSIEEVWFHEPNTGDSFELAQRLQKDLSMSIRAEDSVAKAVLEADIIVVTGNAMVEVKTVKAGAHLTVLGADAMPRSPISEQTLLRSRRFCDAMSPALEWGPPFELELGGVMVGEQLGRQSPDEVTLFASVSPAHLDLITAWHVYEGARHDESLTRIDLEA